MYGNSKQEKIQAWLKRMAGEAIDQQIATRLHWDLKIGLTADVAALVRFRDELARAISEHATGDYRVLELFDIVEWKRQRVRR